MRLSFPVFLIGLFVAGNLELHGVETNAVREAARPLKASEFGVGRLVADATFKDVDGRELSLRDVAGKKPLVIALTGTSCPLCLKYAATLANLSRKYADKGVAFLFVNPTKSDSIDDLRAAMRTHAFQGPYVHDTDGTLAEALDAMTSTEVFLIDSASTLVYRGAVDDQYGFGYALDEPRHAYLSDAIDALLAGEQPTVAATSAPGCELDIDRKPRPTPNASLTYHNRISRIVQANCLQCHREGGVAPFSLESSDDVIAHAGMIRRVVDRGIMPPWFAAAPEKGPSLFANDRSLAERDKADLLAWLNGDRPIGDPRDMPLPRKFPANWNIGEPDEIVQIPQPIAVKATGQMPYQNVRVTLDFDEEKWVQAVEIQPTDRAVVHHVLVFASDGKRGGRVDEQKGFFAAYVPGNTFQIYSKGFAKRLPAGSTLHFQIHYTPIGTATEDQTRLGIVFAKQPPRHVVRNTGIANHRISIPPGAANHPENATQRIPADVKLLSFLPHMHLRGKAFRYDVVFPDKTRRTLLDVPRYDFNWQLQYVLTDPLEIPRGSRLELTAHYDNSEANPANPDPTATVKWGPQTDDEMMLGYVEYYVPSKPVDASNADNAAR